jgi:hypothetical protein
MGLAGAAERVPTRSFSPPERINFRDPPREYIEREASGWTVRLERELVDLRPQEAAAVVRRLEATLVEVLQLLPEQSHQRLRSLTLFVMLGPAARGGGRDNGAEYFRRIDPGHHAELDLRWRSAVVVYSASNYLKLDDHWAVQLLLHEFAHAWHLEQWPERQAEILAAWRQAVAERRYEQVADVNGARLETAYAAFNQLEYFAELSCAYFWRGEYEPFDRESLRRHDPAGFALIERMWGIHASPPCASDRAGQVE